MDIANILELSDRNLILATGVAVATFLTMTIKTLRDASDFREHFTRRHLKRDQEFLSYTKEKSILNLFLEQTIEEEIFKVSSGIKVSRQKAIALMEIYSTGLLSKQELRGINRYVEINSDGSLKIEPPWGEKFFAYYSVIIAIVLFLSGIITFILLAATKGVIGFIMGAIIFFLFTLAARILMEDFRLLKTATKLKKSFEQPSSKNQ